MAKADAARIEALAKEILESALDYYNDTWTQYAIAQELSCKESDVPAIIEKARSLLPKAG